MRTLRCFLQRNLFRISLSLSLALQAFCSLHLISALIAALSVSFTLILIFFDNFENFWKFCAGYGKVSSNLDIIYFCIFWEVSQNSVKSSSSLSFSVSYLYFYFSTYFSSDFIHKTFIKLERNNSKHCWEKFWKILNAKL